MPTRQRPWPRQWLIVDRPPTKQDWQAIRNLPRGSGVLLVSLIPVEARRQLGAIARSCELVLTVELLGAPVRVHNQGELTRAMLRRTPMILISPLFKTASHPDWSPLPRMRAAALARLARRRAVALGGMNRKRYATIAPLGFIGWAGISAFRT